MLKDKAEALPEKPGIYFFKNAKGETIYIGKARDLRDRVKSYFQPTDDIKVRSILSEAADIDYILTGSEREAAFLENNFVQQLQPKFNLRLKDDKSFPYLKLTAKDAFPAVTFSRKVAADGARYFGPFSPARDARAAIRLIGKNFRVRSCAEEIPGRRKRPCLEYDMKMCSAPCVGLIGRDEYRKDVDTAVLFLEGNTERLARALAEKMRQAADDENFEEAARLRDIIKTLDQIKVKPKLISVGLEDQDIFGLARSGGNAAAYVFIMRRGKVKESHEFALEGRTELTDREILEKAMSDFYAGRERPKKILVPFLPTAAARRKDVLGARAGGQVDVIVPVRGKNRGLVELAVRNAEIALRKQAVALSPLASLQEALGLSALPVRIEGLDISNTGGTEAVAALVTFVHGKPDKDGYRKYKVKSVEGPNDVAGLGEVVRRRYRRLLKERQPLPDLVMVDGGKPQFGAAREVLDELGLERLPLVSLAKKQEIIFSSRHGDGLRLDRTSPALKLVQYIRDEAHRFAVKYHRQRRTKRSFA
jgi:excinuclease ABC subunit C